MAVTWVLSISVLLQFTAAFLAIRLIKVTRNSGAWLLIASAIILMGLRRLIPLYRLLSGDWSRPPDLTAELVALVISFLMVMGIACIAPLFRVTQRTEQEVRHAGISLIVFGIFGTLLVLIWLDEIIDVPHLLLGAQPTPINWQESLIETGLVICLGIFVSSRIIRYIADRKQAEELLRRETAFSQSVIRSLPGIFYVISKDGKLARWNKNFERVSGYSTRELSRKNTLDFFAGEEKDIIAERIREVFAKGESSVEALFVSKKGKKIPYYFTGLRTRLRNKLYLVGMGIDITERKQAEEELRQSEEKYHLLSEFTYDWIYWLDNDYRFVYSSPSCEQFTGYPAEEFISEPSLFHRIIHPDDRALFDEHRKVYHPSLDYGEAEYRIICKDGSVRWTWHVCKPIVTEDGRCLGRRSSNRDITERKQAEEALQASSRFLQIAYSGTELSALLKEFVKEIKDYTGCAAVGIRILDQEGKIPYQAYEGFSRSFYEMESPLSIKSDKCMCINVIKGDVDPRLPFYTEGGSFYMNGTTRFLATVSEEEKGQTRNVCNQVGYESVALVPIRLKDNILGLIHIADPREGMVPLNIVEVLEKAGMQMGTAILRRQAEEHLKKTLADLERSNKELEQFAYVASHDLQEPLRMVSSYTQLLERRYKAKLDNDAQEFIAYAVDGANRMQRLIQDLLSFSRVSTRGNPFRPTDCNVVLGQARTNLDVIIRENNALVTNDELPLVMADETQLLLVFQNLINNAIKFRSKELPHVQVSAEKNGHEWIFSVRDNGQGIDPQYYDRIFVIFQRLHAKEEYPGTGIGLAICKRIVERHGGRIWLESKPGKGSTFYFTIPVRGGEKV
jgi:PAS domain S-box-containing protein